MLRLGLSAEYFASQEIFDQETSRIFDRSWLCVGRNDILDHHYRTVDLENTNVLLIRRGETIRAFHNVCRHRGAIVCDADDGALSAGYVTCSYHAWRYRADGALESAPNMSGVEGFRREDYGLLPINCDQWNGYLFVTFDDDAASLAESFGPLNDRLKPWSLAQLEVVSTLTYDVQANWKLLFQNFSECYHCPTVHPALNRLSPYKSAGNDVLAGAILGGPMQLNDTAETMSTDGRLVGATLSGLNKSEQRQVGYYTCFPSVFISPHPDYVMVHRLSRRAVDKTEVVCEFLMEPTDNCDPTRAVEFWDETNRQDWHVCELVQRGASTPGFRKGPYSPHETVLPLFDEHYQAVMNQ